ncbi:MAG: hypothetical protein ABR924_11885, partial [Terracidiphilus sp.]
MLALIAGTVAAFLGGILLGFWRGTRSAKPEKFQLERLAKERADELTAVRAELGRTQAESAQRAGFESLAAEREKAVGLLTIERDGLRQELRAESDVVGVQGRRIAELTAELEGERKSLAEKLALLDAAKQALANQFEALAGEILEKKSKSFS